MTPSLRRVRATWHAATVLVVATAVVVQLVLVIRGVDVLIEDDGTSAAAPERVLRFFSYFTVQSNLLALVTAARLVRDPERDGRVWRLCRLAAVLGMAVTFVVYQIVLAPLLDLDGLAWFTDVLFHDVAPILTVGGWLAFGPRPRFGWPMLAIVVAWPLVYFAYTQALGAASGWYPYPFLDAADLGVARLLVNVVGVTLVVVGFGAVLVALDRRLGGLGRVPVRGRGGADPDSDLPHADMR